MVVNERDNAAVKVVAAGWATVRPAGGQSSPFHEDLSTAQSQAESKCLGMWASEPPEPAVRTAVSDFDASGFVQRIGKGRSVDAIVEQVISGSMLRVTLLPDLIPATVMVAGIQAPSMGRKTTADGEESAAEPLAREAKLFTEFRTLNRDVKIMLEGTSQFGALVGSVGFPAPSTTATAHGVALDADLATALVKAGLAKAAEWSLNMMTTGAFRLREADRAARLAHLGVWKDYVAPATATSKLSDTFTGEVSEVVSGDVVVVRDSSSDEERRVHLSSIRAPRMGTRDRQPDPWALEAKEFLRQRLIGKQVSVSLEYTRKADERTLSFGTVTLTESNETGVENKSNKSNVAELLLVRGLAEVVKHKAEEERSAFYEDLMSAEENGKRSKKGQWSSKEATVPRINDVSQPGSATRAKQHLPFLQRAGKITGIVEHVLSAHKVKVYIPKESVMILFSPSGVRCPQRAMPATAGRPAVSEEPYAAEAYVFTRSRIMQREVELEVDSVDKSGTFMGTLRVPSKKINLGIALLEAGLAKLHPSFEASRVLGGRELEAAEAKARSSKLRVWQNYDEAAPAVAKHEDENGHKAQRERVVVIVTDVTDGNQFHVQMAKEPRVAWLADQLSAMDLDSTPVLRAPLKVGDNCLVRFSVDNQWYRAKVEKAHVADPTAPSYDVTFIDFGNKDRVKGDHVRPTAPDIAAVPPQGHLAGLAYIKAPGVDSELGAEAAQYLSDLVGGGKRLAAFIEQRERIDMPSGKTGWGSASAKGSGATKMMLTLFEDDDDDDDDDDAEHAYGGTVNAKMVAAGLARVVKSRGATQEVVQTLLEVEEGARRKHVGIYEYGDPGSDDDDDAAFPSLGKRH